MMVVVVVVVVKIMMMNNNEDNTNICNKNTSVHNSISIFETLLIDMFED